jgi:hypothetical protein
VKAAVTGDGITFMKFVKQIVQRYPKFDEGVPHIYDGAFKLGAFSGTRGGPKMVWVARANRCALCDDGHGVKPPQEDSMDGQLIPSLASNT